MRVAIRAWRDLNNSEQTALAPILGSDPIHCFDQECQQAGRDSLVNIYYLLTSDRVAGNLWQYVERLCWSSANQIGFEARELTNWPEQLLASGNFCADGWLTCAIKRSCWSVRQLRIDGQSISEHGLQIYRPNNPARPTLLVADIDTIVFSTLLSWPRHAIDILRPDVNLNDPLIVRQVLTSRGIFPQLQSL